MTTLNNKYQQGKIYKIVDNGYNKTYYGSTTTMLSARMAQHRNCYKRYLNKIGLKTTSFDIFDEYGIENCKIELVELFPCNLKEELEAREGFYMKNNECVNRTILTRTRPEYRKQYHQNNKEKIIERVKQYKENNPEKVATFQKHYRDEHKANAKSYAKAYYEKNKEKLSQYSKQRL